MKSSRQKCVRISMLMVLSHNLYCMPSQVHHSWTIFIYGGILWNVPIFRRGPILFITTKNHRLKVFLTPEWNYKSQTYKNYNITPIFIWGCRGCWYLKSQDKRIQCPDVTTPKQNVFSDQLDLCMVWLKLRCLNFNICMFKNLKSYLFTNKLILRLTTGKTWKSFTSWFLAN